MQHLTTAMGLSPTLGLEGFFLMNLWKPFLILIPFVPWAHVVSRVLDKHAARFFLNRDAWNMVHLVTGLVALIAVLAPYTKSEASFWIGWGIMIVLLVADVIVFALVANKDERVPAEHHLKLDFSSLAAKREAKAAAKLQGKVELVLKGPDKVLVPAPNGETPEFAVRLAAEQVYIKATSARASQIDIQPSGKEGVYAVSYLVDGVRSQPEPMPAAEAIKVMDFWKSVAKLDVNDRRKKQVADIAVERGDSRKKVRLTTIGGQGGMRVTMLFDPESQVRRKGAELGLLEPQMKALQDIIADAHGVVLLGAPLDGGRTTTMYSVLKMHDAYTKNVQTIEIDVQDALEGVRQNKFDPQADGAEYSTLTRTIMRRDPDVVGIAELPDPATAKEIARVDQERTRTYVSLKSESAMQALQTWMKAVGDLEQGSKCLRGAVGQKLIRKLCINCRVAYQPSPEMVKKLGLPPDKVKQLFKKGGQVLIKNKPEVCPICGGIGYIGQDGVFEVFPIGPAERAHLKAGDWNALKVEFRKAGLPTIQQAALKKAIDGTTSVEEVLRITTDGQQPAPAAAPAVAAPGAANGQAAPAAKPATAQNPKTPAKA
ncbi:MAG TPA: ATPase, T2SS/T4P/T4SS family [Phycisphaerales bacterium]|nr:ATPase, T2SS/T4P/T4SS family [Phycisphaerales bacterium]